MGTIRYIKTRGNPKEVTAAEAPSLGEMQRFVGGDIELLPLPRDKHDEHWLVVNDCGAVDGKSKPNAKATAMFRAAYPRSQATVFGDVIELINLRVD